MKPQAISLNEVISAPNHEPLWVMNDSVRSHSPGGNVYIAVSWKGAVKNLEIPRTWIPIELTSMMPREAIKDSMYFLEAVNKGLIVPITKKSAEGLLAQPDALEEKLRIESAAKAVAEAVKSRGIGKNVTVNVDGRESEEDAEAPKKKTMISMLSDSLEDEPKEAVSSGFKAWVQKLNTLDSDSKALGEIKRRGAMEMEEAKYLVENLEHPRITNLLKQKVS